MSTPSKPELWGAFSSQKPKAATAPKTYDAIARVRAQFMIQHQLEMEAQFFRRRGITKPVPTLTVTRDNLHMS